MQVSTIVDGIAIAGTVVRHTPLFIEVAINSPIEKISTRRCLPTARHTPQTLTNDEIIAMSEAMLKELFQLGKELNQNTVINLRCNKDSLLRLAS